MYAENIKSLLEGLAHWTVPLGFQQLLQHRYHQLRVRRVVPDFVRDQVSENTRFRNCHDGEKCFLLGTGPSIEKQDLTPLADEYCISMSSFPKHEKTATIAPEYHVYAPNHPPHEDELPREYLTAFDKNVQNDCTVFFGHRPYEHSFYRFLQSNPEFRPESMTYIDYSYTPDLTEETYDSPEIWDISGRPFGFYSTVVMAIQVAAYMRFDRIVLLGIDWDYLEYLKERQTSRRFYDQSEDSQEDITGQDDIESTADMLAAYEENWRQFELIRDALDSADQYVYNATAGGLLNVYPRVSLEEAIESDLE